MTDAALRRAFALLASPGAGWPPTLTEALASPMHARILRVFAAHLPPERLPPTMQESPPKRAPRDSWMAPPRARQLPLVDLKRRAANDQDD